MLSNTTDGREKQDIHDSDTILIGEECRERDTSLTIRLGENTSCALGIWAGTGE
jgi:hypothetical protein